MFGKLPTSKERHLPACDLVGLKGPCLLLVFLLTGKPDCDSGLVIAKRQILGPPGQIEGVGIIC